MPTGCGAAVEPDKHQLPALQGPRRLRLLRDSELIIGIARVGLEQASAVGADPLSRERLRAVRRVQGLSLIHI